VLRFDSAGVEVTEIAPGATRSRVTLSNNPLVAIGGLSSDPEAELYQVTGAVRLPSGQIVIANAGTHELKVFGSDGQHIRTVGREGEGPGEFKGIAWISLHSGDSVLAYDRQQHRIQVFDRDLELGRVTVLRVPSDLGVSGLAGVGAFRDGSLLARGPELVLEYPREPLYRHLFLFDPEGILSDSLGPIRSAREIWMGGEPWPPFDRKAAFLVREESFYTSTSDTDEVRRFGQAGDLQRIVRGGHELRPVTQEHIAAALEGRPPIGIGEPWVAPNLPIWSELFIDDLGAVWRKEYPARDGEVARWEVIGAQGGPYAEAEIPADLQPLQIGGDFMLAVRADTLGVEHVVLLGLTRGEGARD
jgi:hypothetical protein